MDNLFKDMSPQQMGLLQAGLAILSNNRGKSLGESLGAGGMAGLQAMQQQQQLNSLSQAREAQMARYQAMAQQEQAEVTKRAKLEELAKNIDTKKLSDPAYKSELYKQFGMYNELLKQGQPGEKVLFNDATQGGFVIDKLTGEPKPLTYGGRQLRAAPYDVGLQGDLSGARKRQSEAESIVDVPTETGQTQYMKKGDAVTNFGNIRPAGKSAGFMSYATPEDGLKAIDDNLLAYKQKHGINTLAGIISRWAPPSENDTASYIADASKRLSIDPNQEIDLSNPAVRQAIGTSIMLHEQGPKKVFGQSTREKKLQEKTAELEAERIGAREKEKVEMPKVIDTADYTLSLLNDLKSHEGLGGVVGVPNLMEYVPGTKEAGFKARLDQLSGRQFLEAFEKLKGGGQITEVEGKKATDAISRIQNTKQSEEEFLSAIDEISEVIKKGKMRSYEKTGVDIPSENDNLEKKSEVSSNLRLSPKAMMLPKAQRSEMEAALKSGDPADIENGVRLGFFSKETKKEVEKPRRHNSVIVR